MVSRRSRGKVLAMTPREFRKIALFLPETEERSHMDHPDFRVAGKIFATLGYPDKDRGMVKLSPEDQHNFSKDYPEAFIPAKGMWGRRGATSVDLQKARKQVLTRAIKRPGAAMLPSGCWLHVIDSWQDFPTPEKALLQSLAQTYLIQPFQLLRRTFPGPSVA